MIHCKYGDPETNARAFWSPNQHASVLHYTGIDECIDEHLADLEYRAEKMPEKLTLYGYDRMTVTVTCLDAGDIVEQVLERLDDNYATADGAEPTQPTDKMIEAARAFIAVMLAEYEPYDCEVSCKVEVDVAAWLLKKGEKETENG